MSSLSGTVARGLYSLALLVLAPLYLARLWRRGRSEPAYRLDWPARFGRHAGTAEPGWVWVHAVSLGETRASQALVGELRRRLPGMRLLLTHGTATGREAGAGLLQPGDRQTWLPYDTPGSVARFLLRFRPRVGVLMETEVWPNLLHAAHRIGVPMVLANARLSERSLRRSLRFDALMRPAVRQLALVLAQTQDDAERLRLAGATRVERCGNLKYDLAPEPRLLELGARWRAQTGRDVVLAAITRSGEEAMLLASWRELAEPRPLLLIVPRHPQRFDEVAALVESSGLSLARRSRWDDEPPAAAWHAQVWLGDSMREMPMYYAMAHVALLGGSFAPLGGHNLIEAAACGCPVVMGPHTYNFAEAAELSVASGAARRATDMTTGVREALHLLEPAQQSSASRCSLEFAAEQRGAAKRMAERIAALLADD